MVCFTTPSVLFHTLEHVNSRAMRFSTVFAVALVTASIVQTVIADSPKKLDDYDYDKDVKFDRRYLKETYSKCIPRLSLRLQGLYGTFGYRVNHIVYDIVRHIIRHICEYCV
ncbi:hypothetical protein D915_007789 [Fasciola hepatica]|uniref:Uncharacterized protein n=1 Tax=Fasciola hepatica TaxID=6192 RepID=A0A4E0RIX2_FASHE|nr:hypothetical protein D915_007789 [Fasciola hepatica]